jgi:hypothetical protein
LGRPDVLIHCGDATQGTEDKIKEDLILLTEHDQLKNASLLIHRINPKKAYYQALGTKFHVGANNELTLADLCRNLSCKIISATPYNRNGEERFRIGKYVFSIKHDLSRTNNWASRASALMREELDLILEHHILRTPREDFPDYIFRGHTHQGIIISSYDLSLLIFPA